MDPRGRKPEAPDARLSAADRLGAWLVTGPVGRVAAFAGDLGVALGGWALRRAGLRRDPE